MTKEQFAELLKSELEEATGCEVVMQPILKNNNVELTSLTIKRQNRNTSPTIYAEHFWEMFESGESIESIIDKILEYENNYKLDIDFNTDDFTNYNKIKNNIYYKLVNYRANKKLLESIPHNRVLDLVKIYYAVVESPELGTGTITINKEHMKYWGISEKELEQLATFNTETKMQPTIKNVKEIVKKILMEMFYNLIEDGEIPEDMNIPDFDNISNYPMYVVSNEDFRWGASVMTYKGFLKVVSDVMNDDLIIFPSSIHEFIFIKAEIGEEMGYEVMKDIVASVNNQGVSEEEYLSDSLYKYDRNRDTLVICGSLEDC